MRGIYEIIIIYDKEYGEVITFESLEIMNDSNDIVTEAIRLELMEEEYRDRVRWAHCVSEYEYEYIKEGGCVENEGGDLYESWNTKAT